MDTKHTPAPWYIKRYTNYIGYSIHADNRGCIAERWYDTEQSAPYGSEIEANARLISVAPELLSVLEDMVQKYSALKGTGAKHLIECNDALELITKARG